MLPTYCHMLKEKFTFKWARTRVIKKTMLLEKLVKCVGLNDSQRFQLFDVLLQDNKRLR